MGGVAQVVSFVFGCSRVVIFLKVSSCRTASFPDHLDGEEAAFVGAFVSVPISA